MSWRAWPSRIRQAFVARLSPPRDGALFSWQRGNRLFSVVCIGSLIGGASFDVWLVTCGFSGCPTDAQIVSYAPPEGGRVLDRNGELIGRLHAINRINVPLSAVPAHVRQAFIATEDRRFASHHGIDGRGILRSVVRNARALRVREGFSTITMQVARNAFLSDEAALSRSLGRKFIEIHLAQRMERLLSKDRILGLYLNEIYLGNGVYGVEGASRDLFGKGVRSLSVAEGAMLAALPKGPSAYTPKDHPERARGRRDLVLQLMRREGYLDARAHARASAQEVRVARRDWRVPQPNESWALDLVRQFTDSLLRAAGVDGGEVVVRTTLDLTAQRAAERAIRTHAARIEGAIGWWTEGTERVQGAMVALDPRDGSIRALVGGRHHDRQGFNRATSARRQPGSAFKPFVYAAALGAGFTPATVVDDEPLSIQVGDDEWTPANYGDEYRGPVTLRQALAQSANAATVRISRAVGERRVVDVARRNGIGSELRAVPALALGAVEVTPLELVTAYAPFANGGSRVRPRLVHRITSSDGRVLYEGPVTREPVMDPVDAFQVTSMLRSVVDEGTGRAVRAAGVTGPVAGKTGTTNGGTDAWFVGYTPTIVAGFWFGYDRPQPMGDAVNGGRYAAPAWGDFYRQGWRERNPGWRVPTGLVAVEIDAASGKLANDWCGDARREYFRPGTEPTDHCEGSHPGWNIGDLVEDLADEDWRPLARQLRRLIER
jgi:penicillin-binding protein 1A